MYLEILVEGCQQWDSGCFSKLGFSGFGDYVLNCCWLAAMWVYWDQRIALVGSLHGLWEKEQMEGK